MKVVTGAIKTKFAADVALAAKVTGGLHLNDVPQGTAMPYMVIFVITDLPEDTFNTYCERIRIQMSIFSGTRSSEEVSDIFELVKTCFDYCTLTVTGYSHIEMRRRSSNLMRDPDDNSWHYQVDYDILLQKI